MESQTPYIICTNPRSGSWLLSEGLESTQVAGRPREWFHESTEEEVCHAAGVPLPSRATYAPYLEHIKKAAATANGVFGLKLHYYQFEALAPKLRTLPSCGNVPRTQLLQVVFPGAKYIWLTRRDKVRQAVSYHRACQTDTWSAKGGDQPPRRLDALAEAVFDPHAIEQLEHLLASNEVNWQRYFQEIGARPLVLAYEDLAADYLGVIRQALQWLGIPAVQSIVIPPPALKKQADSRTEEWIERYLRFKSGRLGPAAVGGGDIASETIPHHWKRWIGENKLLKTDDAAVIDVLIKSGVSAELAAAEVHRAAADPYLQAGDWAVQRLKKMESLVGVYRELAKARPNAGTIERRSDVSRREFFERYYVANRPVILRGLMSTWNAMRLWSPDYLKTLLGGEEVEIMAGRANDADYEINAHQHRRQVRFHEYVDMVHGGDETNDYYLVANNAFFKRPAAKELLRDIESFPEYLDRERTEDQIFFWYGPAGTVTPLHHDTSNILMAQVWGRKRIKLISPTDSEFLYNDVGVFSPIDCDNPNLQRWPLYGHAKVVEVVLEPEEVLFLPVGWWHHVRALEVSLTISFTNFVFPNHYEWKMPQIRK